MKLTSEILSSSLRNIGHLQLIEKRHVNVEMAVGKNKKMGKKGAKKKLVDPFTRKEWYDIKAPSMFTNRQVGKTLVNRTQGTSKYKYEICVYCLAFKYAITF